MGFGRHTGIIQIQRETVSVPQGWVVGCTRYDSSNWHWCDMADGHWYNEGLGDQGSRDRITQVKCELKNNNTPACVSGNTFSFIGIVC